LTISIGSGSSSSATSAVEKRSAARGAEPSSISWTSANGQRLAIALAAPLTGRRAQ
jgi:hypothetical protein